MKSSKFFAALASVIGSSLAIITLEFSFVKIKPVYANHCGFLDPTCSHNGCSDLDPTCNPNLKPITKPLAEQAWGEAGASGYQAAARIMRERNESGQGLDETQKRFLRQRYGELVDQVRVAYSNPISFVRQLFSKRLSQKESNSHESCRIAI